MIEFHKHQCYYISAIEIAVLVLLKDSLSGSLFNLEVAPMYHVALSVAIAMSGVIPTVFTLISITRHGRLSWYTIILTAVTLSLSSASLAAAWRSWKFNNIGDQLSSIYQSGLNPSIVGLCGSLASNLNSLPPRPFDFRVVFMIYMFSLISFLVCITTHARPNLLGASYDFITHIQQFQLLFRNNRLKTLCYAKKAFQLSYFLLWMSCFAYLFYLYSIFYRNNLVSTDWSFGQIIAVSVWANSVIEFIYLDHSKCITKA